MATKGELTKERILSEATQLFHEKGFGATSINDILSATGLKKGSLYFHFPSKEEIALAVLNQAKEEFNRVMDSDLTGTTPGHCLSNYFETVYTNHSKTNFQKGCFFGNTALEIKENQATYSPIVESIFTAWITGLENVIRAAQEKGQMRDDIEAKILAHHVIATIEGGIMLSKLKKDGKPLRLCLDSLKVLLQLKD